MEINGNNYNHSNPNSYNNYQNYQGGYDPYAQPQGQPTPENPDPQSGQEENQPKEKRFNYLVSLKKKHIILGGVLSMLMFFIFFFMGLFFGYQYSDQKVAQIIDQRATHPINQLGGENTSSFLTPDNKVLSENSSLTPQDATPNKESQLIFDQNIASDVLLKKDLAAKTSAVAPSSATDKVNQPTKSAAVNNRNNKVVDQVTPVPGKNYFYIQVIATSSRDKAKNIYDEFKKRNYPVRVRAGEKLGKKIYQIQLGLYESKSRALKHLKITRNLAGFKEANLLRYRS